MTTTEESGVFIYGRLTSGLNLLINSVTNFVPLVSSQKFAAE